jgi:DNA gyrase/topoisomerase IV subunit A
MSEPVVEGVKPIADGAAAPAAEPVKTVTPAEGQQAASAGVKDVSKYEEELNNLKIALRQERDDKTKTIKALEDQLNEVKPVLDKMRGVFVPPQPIEEKKEYLTAEQLLQILEQKENEKKIEASKLDGQAKIQKEVKEMSSEWNGESGKPKYDDAEVLAWQSKEGKLNLTPRAAFYEMKLNDIVDWKVKSATSNPAPAVVAPGGGGERVPSDPNKITPENILDAVKAELNAALTE